MLSLNNMVLISIIIYFMKFKLRKGVIRPEISVYSLFEIAYKMNSLKLIIKRTILFLLQTAM